MTMPISCRRFSRRARAARAPARAVRTDRATAGPGGAGGRAALAAPSCPAGVRLALAPPRRDADGEGAARLELLHHVLHVLRALARHHEQRVVRLDHDQILDPHQRDHALYMAFAPAEDPQIALAVVVENAGFGAAHAAPIARRVFDYLLLGQYPNEEDLAAVQKGLAAGPIGKPRDAGEVFLCVDARLEAHRDDQRIIDAEGLADLVEHGVANEPRWTARVKEVLALVGLEKIQIKKFERYEAGLLGGLFAIVGGLIMVLEH